MMQGGGGEKPPNPYVIPVASRECFGVGLCWDLCILQAMIDIISEHSVIKNNKNQLFSPCVLGLGFDLFILYHPKGQGYHTSMTSGYLAHA